MWIKKLCFNSILSDKEIKILNSSTIQWHQFPLILISIFTRNFYFLI